MILQAFSSRLRIPRKPRNSWLCCFRMLDTVSPRRVQAVNENPLTHGDETTWRKPAVFRWLGVFSSDCKRFCTIRLLVVIRPARRESQLPTLLACLSIALYNTPFPVAPCYSRVAWIRSFIIVVRMLRFKMRRITQANLHSFYTVRRRLSRQLWVSARFG